jgi:hypothetical protein
MVGVNGYLLPKGTFAPKFHVQCRYAVAPLADGLPHYASFPAAFGGADEMMNW